MKKTQQQEKTQDRDVASFEKSKQTAAQKTEQTPDELILEALALEKERALMAALDVISGMEDALETLYLRLEGLSGAAEAGQFAMIGEAPTDVAEKLFYSLSESLRDESKLAEDAASLRARKTNECAALKSAYYRRLPYMRKQETAEELDRADAQGV